MQPNKPFCKAPYSGLTVNPTLDIVQCCVDQWWLDGKPPNLRDVNLKDYFYNSQEMIDRREQFLKPHDQVERCKICSQQWKAGEEHIVADFYNQRNPEDVAKFRFLEVTTSNTCNQACVMCFPNFSTKLAKIWRAKQKEDPEFVQEHLGKTYSEQELSPSFMVDEDLEKIYEVLPGLTTLFLKGGEPFADKNNLKILRRANKETVIDIISNGSSIPDEFIKELKRFDEVHIGFSIDGTDDIFEWIRGSKYKKSIDNMERFFQETGQVYKINVAVQIMNLHGFTDLLEDASELEGLTRIEFNNIVTNPEFLSARMWPQSYIDKAVSEFEEVRSWYDLTIHSNLHTIKSFEDDKRKELTPKLLQRIKMYNQLRGIDITKINPKLSIFY